MNGLLAYGGPGVEATLVVLNNGGGGIFDFLPIARTGRAMRSCSGRPPASIWRRSRTFTACRSRAWRHYATCPAHWRAPGWWRSLDRPRNVELHRELFERAAAAARAAVERGD